MLFFIILICTALLIAVFWRPRWTLYVLIFLAPFLGLVVDFSQYSWSRYLPYLGKVQAPAADLLALFLLAAMVWKTLVTLIRKRRLIIVPATIGLWYFLPFAAVCLISLTNTSSDQFLISIKYFLRPVLFAYLTWLVLPNILINTKDELSVAVKVFFGVGILATLWSLAATWWQPAEFGFWRRITAGELWGLAPLTNNHNILAEVLVAAVPIGGYLFIQEKTSHWKKWYFLSFLVILATALLTFSRAAWLALLAQLCLWTWFKFYAPAHLASAQDRALSRRRLSHWWPRVVAILLVVLPLAVYMWLFAASPLVQSSNATRLDLTGIALVNWARHPWLGNGIGSFLPLVADSWLFHVEYGDPLDSHGVIQKLLAELGLLGLAAFVLFISWALHRSYLAICRASGQNRLLVVSLFVSVAGMLVYELFNTSYYNAHLWLPLGLLLAAVKVLSF